MDRLSVENIGVEPMTFPHCFRDALCLRFYKLLDISLAFSCLDRSFHSHCLRSCRKPLHPAMLPGDPGSGTLVPASVMVADQPNFGVLGMPHIVAVPAGAVYDVCGKGHKGKGLPLCEAALWVENIGVEPMTSCMPCKRSSQLS